MVLHHHRQIGPSDRKGPPLQVLQHLRRPHVVDHHAIHVEQRPAAFVLGKAMLRPDLVEQGRAHGAVSLPDSASALSTLQSCSAMCQLVAKH